MWIGARYLTFVAMLALPYQAYGQGGGQGTPSGPSSTISGTPAVLELYTSQGCSSCPPADALLKSYTERRDMVALSFPVDYWDHLGWKDTLASPKHTQRQKAYAKTLGNGNVYTPQIVIDGSAQTIGSKKAEIEKAIARTGGARRASVPVVASSGNGRVMIDIGGVSVGQANTGSGTVWLVIVTPKVDVKIQHGENRGQMLAYYNVVREMTAVGMWDGKPLKLELPATAVMKPGDRCAVLLQAGEGGRIIGATWMTP